MQIANVSQPRYFLPPSPLQHDLWNGKFSVRFHGKSFPGHRKKLDRYPEKYPRYIMASIHPSESFLNLNPWARIIVASARRFGRTLCPNEISSITEYRSRLPRISCPLLKGMNLIVPRFAKPVRNRRRLESLWISCLNRVPGIHGGGGEGGCSPEEEQYIRSVVGIGESKLCDRQLDVAHQRGKIFFVPPVRGEERGRG